MELTFYKYQGTGNDFILIDNRDGKVTDPEMKWIAELCARRFGIGADGLMFLENEQGYDFKMVYFNADGRESSMCGNGGRCITAFARKLGIIKDTYSFLAIDGPHEAVVRQENDHSCLVSLKMKDVNLIEQNEDYLFLDTGSPHYVKFVEGVNAFNVVEEGRKVRYSARFNKEGTNVNFVEPVDDMLAVRTYERGVEDETFSCGTGVTAAALAASISGRLNGEQHCRIKTLGGNITVYFKRKEDLFTDIWLEGPATYVFEGKVDV